MGFSWEERCHGILLLSPKSICLIVASCAWQKGLATRVFYLHPESPLSPPCTSPPAGRIAVVRAWAAPAPAPTPPRKRLRARLARSLRESPLAGWRGRGSGGCPLENTHEKASSTGSADAHRGRSSVLFLDLNMPTDYFASPTTSSKFTAMSCLVGTHSTFLNRAATVMGM